ncbi:MAG: UDP-N-acetylmuramate dehydrogenase [Clostridia bacterium]|nr:UDP-N-acetylmuramate dehydrogenase [Clostridia bacterium]
MKKLEDFLIKNQIIYRTDLTLADLSTFKIGGKADMVVYPSTEEQCTALIRFAKKQGEKLIFLGNGSNVLCSDDGCRNWILKTEGLNRLQLDKNHVLTVGAGVRLVKASSFTAKEGLTGMEFAYGIPGSMGGAIFMNAGAYGGSMDQIVIETRYLDSNGDPHILKGERHQFGYRHSFFTEHPDYLIIETRLQLQPGDKKEILATIEDLQNRRKEKQPLEYPSAGSTFKRPEGYFAGKLIQDAGLRGHSIGGAQVSEKHCGFIINAGGASCKDIKELIRYVQQEVKKQFDVQLECEVRELGAE